MSDEFRNAQSDLNAKAEKLADLIQTRLLKVGRKVAVQTVKCFDDNGEDYKAVERCQQDAAQPAMRLQQELQHDSQAVSNMIQSCVNACMPSSASNSELMANPDTRKAVEAEFDRCAAKCVRDAMPKFDQLEKTSLASIDRVAKE
ncbi:hypothetical protein FOL47_011383 [Perkinsus chesapeaki]|uniref:Uncharacterized protein n=1 Tax=Perkinsus chesapeaki TaxID=330153 RepID=A0A7J6KZL6_PERCH|nr:hypothetical protein FOL47_011383 [Perkinsus chesapeaki]